MDRLLSVCIPTHHGRCALLSELINSIDSQVENQTRELISVCISDNGSQDGTQEMVSRWSQRAQIPINYFRFEKNEGLLNFENVIDMADAAFCWMVGSDDLVPPGAIEKILEIIKSDPLRPGFTFNKLNFNLTYTKLIGRDDDIVLPKNWRLPRQINSFDEITSDMFFLFQFISGHVFRKECWKEAFSSFGRAGFQKMNHFAFSAIIIQITKDKKVWHWYPDFLITQRLGNSFLVNELGRYEFAVQCTNDLIRVLAVLFPPGSISRQARYDLLRKTYIIYWNPFLLLEYKSMAPFNIRQDLQMLVFCWRHFSILPLFIVTAGPVLLLPGFFGMLIRKTGVAMLYTIRKPILSRFRLFLRKNFIKILEILKIGSNTELNLEPQIAAKGQEVIDYVLALKMKA